MHAAVTAVAEKAVLSWDHGARDPARAEAVSAGRGGGDAPLSPTESACATV